MRRLIPSVLFNTDDPGAATPPAPEPVAAQPPAPAAPPQPAPVGDGPWANDIRATFQDPAVQAQVDAFLRSKVQPHVTQIEQQYAPARELWQDLQGDDSAGTYVAIAEQLYGPEVAQQVAAQLQQQPATPEPTAQPTTPQLSAEDQAAIDFAKQQRAESLWRTEMDRVLAADGADTLKGYANDQVRDAAFAPFVQASGGDFDAALQAFNQWHAVAVPQPPAPPAPEAPATLTGDGAPAAIPPTQQTNQTLDGALDDFLAERRAGAPATVGQV
jgi:hypothetical protein